jgi:hypothetical protein
MEFEGPTASFIPFTIAILPFTALPLAILPFTILLRHKIAPLPADSVAVPWLV